MILLKLVRRLEQKQTWSFFPVQLNHFSPCLSHTSSSHLWHVQKPLGRCFFLTLRGGDTRLTFSHDIPADRCKSRQKHRVHPVTRPLYDWGPVGLEWGVGKQAFESQDSCNGSYPCSKTRRASAVNSNGEVLIYSIEDWMIISGIDAGRSVLRPLHKFPSGFLWNVCEYIYWLFTLLLNLHF